MDYLVYYHTNRYRINSLMLIDRTEWDIYDSFTFVEFLVALFGVSILDRGFHDVMICLEIV